MEVASVAEKSSDLKLVACVPQGQQTGLKEDPVPFTPPRVNSLFSLRVTHSSRNTFHVTVRGGVGVLGNFKINAPGKE